MKKRLEIVINNLYDEKLELMEEIKKISWSMKYASLMTPNGKEQKDELLKQLNDVNKQIEQLEWILEG